jgi:hypothetical protein
MKVSHVYLGLIPIGLILLGTTSYAAQSGDPLITQDAIAQLQKGKSLLSGQSEPLVFEVTGSELSWSEECGQPVLDGFDLHVHMKSAAADDAALTSCKKQQQGEFDVFLAESWSDKKGKAQSPKEIAKVLGLNFSGIVVLDNRHGMMSSNAKSSLDDDYKRIVGSDVPSSPDEPTWLTQMDANYWSGLKSEHLAQSPIAFLDSSGQCHITSKKEIENNFSNSTLKGYFPSLAQAVKSLDGALPSLSLPNHSDASVRVQESQEFGGSSASQVPQLNKSAKPQ